MDKNLMADEITARTGHEYLRKFLEADTWDKDGFQTLLLQKEKDGFELDCQEWIARFASTDTDFMEIKQRCIDLLEHSNFLNYYDDDILLRTSYQERLTQIAEYTSYYDAARQYTLNDADHPEQGAKAYINDLFSKLKKSGFVYHPHKHINIMMCLFVLKPELMESSIEELFSIIFNRQLEIWRQYPFRTVLIRALDRYIQNTDDKQSTLASSSSVIDNTIRALVVQLTLGDERDESESIFDRNLNTARLYRYASYKAPSMAMAMFSRAFEFLLGQTTFGVPMYSLYRSKAVDLIANYLNNEMAISADESSTAVWKFENNHVCLRISDHKVLIQPTEVNAFTVNALPEELLPWNHIEIRANDTVRLERVNDTDILPYKNMWRDVETLLFAEHVKAEPQRYVRHHLDEGDETMITIDKAVDDENNTFYCTILDPDIVGEAYIKIADIVSYLNHAFVRNFHDAYGHKLKFLARVESVDDDGVYRMSMKSGIDEYIKSSVYDGMRFSCSVGDSYLYDYGVQRGITYEGYPLAVSVEEKLEKNTRLTGEYTGYDDGYHSMRVDFVDLEPAHKYFSPSEAFQRLMAAYSQYSTAVEAGQDDARKADRAAGVPVMARSHVVELMLLVDRIAILQKDYITSYNYLAVARILARLLGLEEKHRYYNGRMDLIEQLNFFAINNTVDEQKLTELENVSGDMFVQNIILRKRFNQLRIISWLGKLDRNLELRQTWENSAEDEVIRDIAGLALSYNILIQSGLTSQADDVHGQIKNMLNLKGHESNLKSYGTMEDVTCEFKTSIAYVAGTTTFDPETQMDNILKVVDEMLNTRGGIIYLGVNRYGQGVGLKQDLDNILFHNDKEEYIRFIYRFISKKLSPHAANALVRIYFDKENTRQDICIIRVMQSPMGIPFKGEYCVRRGDSVYRYNKEDYEEYRRIRDSIYASEKEVKQTMLDEGLAEVDGQSETVEEGGDIKEKVSGWDGVHASNFIEQIATSTLHIADYNDSIPLRYVNFMGNGCYHCTESQMGNIPLSLPLYEKDEVLVIVYDDGTAVSVPVSGLLDKELSREYHGTTNQRVAFACAASRTDSLLLIVNTKNGGVMRVQDIDRIQRSDMLSQGRKVVSDDALSVELCTLVGDPMRGQLKKCRNQDCDITSKHGKKNMDKLVDMGMAVGK